MFKWLIPILVIICLSCQIAADESEVVGLQDMMSALNGTQMLTNWKVDGGDPCQELWIGIRCSDSKITSLNLRGFNLTGPLIFHGLRYLTYLDLSSNYFTGPIPYELSHSLTNLNLAGNSLVGNIPQSLFFMNNLQYLNLSENNLSGPLNDVFDGLGNLIDLDLSCNDFFGVLPISFKSCKNLSRLFLQNNKFVGSTSVLLELPLKELNIQDNLFDITATPVVSNNTTPAVSNTSTPSTPNPTKYVAIVVSVIVGAIVLLVLLLAAALRGRQGGWRKLSRLSSFREVVMRNIEKTEP